MESVLIVYYSKTGTTRKVCEKTMEVLQGGEFDVSLMEFSQVKDLSVYDTVIMAAPINGMQWVEPAKAFMKDNLRTLQKKKIVVIYISYIIRTGNKFWKKKIKKGLESLTSVLKPLMVKDFGGVIDGDFPAFARWIFGIKNGTPLDVSDDQEVEAFANELMQMISMGNANR